MSYFFTLAPSARLSHTVATVALTLLGTTALNATAAIRSVGPGKSFSTPCSAISGAANGDIIEITGNNTYSGDVCGIYANNLTIRGVNGRPKIDAAGRNAMGKGTWVVIGNDVVIENVEMYGARVPDKNGAALRLEGTNFTLRGSFLHDNENGILSGVNTNSNILIETSEFGYNGLGTGFTHNVYIGQTGSLTFRYNYSHDANVGHNLKTRAIRNMIAYNRFSSTPSGQPNTTSNGQPSYEVDIPNAGTAVVIGNIIQQHAGNSNPALLAFGEEGANNPGQDLYVINNTFLNDDSSRGTFIFIGGGVTTPVLMQNNIFGGVGTVNTQGNAIDRNNFRSLTPSFVNRLQYNLLPGTSAPFINGGASAGQTAAGVSLTPTAHYRHPAGGEARPGNGNLDIGAYESGASAAPTPASQPAPQSTTPQQTGSTWTTCATENGTCNFSGTRQVRYGANNSYATRTATGSVACTNQVFGDPAYGIFKSCQFSSETVAPAQETWTYCSGEYANCSFPGTRQVRYGANGVFAYTTASGFVACSNNVFGDPVYGTVKSCSYSSIAR
ncbi:MAG: hypothetical protein V4695_07795 [Pseudomonadota bacterium]